MNAAKPNEVDSEETPAGGNLLLEERPDAAEDEAIHKETLPEQPPENPETDARSEPGSEVTLKKSILKSFLTCPLFSKKKADELREVHSQSEKINDRIETVESSVKQLEKMLKISIKEMLKEQKGLSKKMQRDGDCLNNCIEGHVRELCSALAGQTAHVQQFQKMALNKIDDAAGTISGVNGSIGGIRDYLSENNKLVQRLQEGYDFQILKNFIRQISRSIMDLDKQIEKLSGDAKGAVIEARDDLVELLERNGVEQIIPEVETSYVEVKKYAEATQDKETTDDPEKCGLIASVERVGYKYEFNDGQERVIQTALVKLYE